MCIIIEIIIALITVLSIMVYTTVLAWAKSSVKLIDIKDYNKVINILSEDE